MGLLTAEKGFGIVFALTMNGITWISRNYLHESAVSLQETLINMWLR